MENQPTNELKISKLMEIIGELYLENRLLKEEITEIRKEVDKVKKGLKEDK